MTKEKTKQELKRISTVFDLDTEKLTHAERTFISTISWNNLCEWDYILLRLLFETRISHFLPLMAENNYDFLFFCVAFPFHKKIKNVTKNVIKNRIKEHIKSRITSDAILKRIDIVLS